MTVDPNSVKTPMIADPDPTSAEKQDLIKTVGRSLYLVVYTIYKTIAVVCQLAKIFYQFLVLLYQYPNATSYAIEVTYNSLLLTYRSGLWDPFNKKKKKEQLEKMPTETAIPISPVPKVDKLKEGNRPTSSELMAKPPGARGPDSVKKTN